MLKALKTAALMCGLLVLHGQQAHAAWQRMYAFDVIPYNAVATGVNGDMYVCRAEYAGGIHPGWTTSAKGVCAFGWGGSEQDAYVYDIWVEDWEPASNGNVPANAIPLGFEISSAGSVARARYACQANDPGYGLASGKVAPDIGGCDYPWGGAEQHATSYNVLVDSAINMVDSTGGPKLTVSEAIPQNTAYPFFTGGFVSTYQMWQTSTLYVGGAEVPSGVEDGGGIFQFCTAYYRDGYHPGKVSSGFGGCDISFGGQEIPNNNPWWTLTQNWQTNPAANYYGGQIPIDQQLQAPSAAFPGGLYQSAVIGGHEADGSNLYLCEGWTTEQPNWDAIYTPGKFSKALGTCSVAVNGKEVLVTGGYSFLVETYTKPAP
jgi:hypothetical protein